MNEWNRTKFSELCERVSVGHVGPTTQFFCKAEEGVPLVRSQNVRPGNLILENVAYISKEFHDTHKKSQLRPGDVLIVRVGANRGDCCVVPDFVGELNCANIVFARPKQKTGFYSYYFQSPRGRASLLGVSVGAAQEVINTGSVAEMMVPMPDIVEQEQIVSVLSSLDKKIELNRKMNEVLEEMGQTLFRNWFVDFEFPWDFEKKEFSWDGKPYKSSGGAMVESELGEIPSAWVVKPLMDHISFEKGAEYGSASYTQDSDAVNFYRVRDIKQSGLDCDVKVPQNLVNKSGVRVYPTDVLISFDGTIGRVFTGGDGTYSSGMRKVIIEDGNMSNGLVYFYAKTPLFQNKLEEHAGGGTTIRHAGSSIDYLRIMYNPEIIKIIGETFNNLLLQIQENIKQTKQLTVLRDLLLPRLMSGKLRVPVE